MVVGKNTAQATARVVTTQKLPPLRTLRIKKPNAVQENPCMAVMSSVLGCWASHGYTTAGCAALEQSLRACMDSKGPATNTKSRINNHLSRLYPQMKGPHKRR